jgi:hypothetical protein
MSYPSLGCAARIAGLGVLIQLGSMSIAAHAQEDGAFAPKKLAATHLPNAYQIHARVISGGLPAGEAGFAELASLGVKTVISVDGAKPDVELARKYGLRYVHLPHGYDGIPALRSQELAKAVRDLPGPIYIHCHHGKHRSPAAAAAACVGAGLLEPTNAEQVLKTAGTSEGYLGLYQAAREARRLDGQFLDSLLAAFPETAQVPPLAEAMVAIEQAHDHLKQIEAAGWTTPANKPALDPAHEALLLREHFTELLRTKEAQERPEAYRTHLQRSEATAIELESVLRNRLPAENAARLLAVLGQNCMACHREFRDTPALAK